MMGVVAMRGEGDRYACKTDFERRGFTCAGPSPSPDSDQALPAGMLVESARSAVKKCLDIEPAMVWRGQPLFQGHCNV
jgi:hypothetical protein